MQGRDPLSTGPFHAAKRACRTNQKQQSVPRSFCSRLAWDTYAFRELKYICYFKRSKSLVGPEALGKIRNNKHLWRLTTPETIVDVSSLFSVGVEPHIVSARSNKFKLVGLRTRPSKFRSLGMRIKFINWL